MRARARWYNGTRQARCEGESKKRGTSGERESKVGDQARVRESISHDSVTSWENPTEVRSARCRRVLVPGSR